MTRHPALEKRIPVAWPMPRLAPVSSSVRRGALEIGMKGLEALSGYGAGVTDLRNSKSRIEPGLRPGLIRRIAAEFDAIVQTERAVVPELDLPRRDSPAAPARRPRHIADEVFGGDLRNRLLESETAFQLL